MSEEHAEGNELLKKKMTRRRAISASAKIGVAVVATAAVAGAVGYIGGTSSSKPSTQTVTQTQTQTATETRTQTVTSTPTSGGETVQDFLKRVSGPYKGQTIRIIAENTASSNWLNDTQRAKFEELTGIKVEYELVGWDDVMRKQLLDAQQKAGTYDLYYIDEREISASRFDNGYILDWYKFANDHNDILWPQFDVGDLLPVRYFTYKGMLAGTPFEHFLRTYIYRKDLFDDPKEQADFKAKYGRSLQPATTWDEYAQLAEFFTRPDQDLYGHVAEPNPVSLPADIFVGLGGYGISGAGYSLGLRASYKEGGMIDSEGAIAWLKRYIQLLKFGPKGIENFTWDDEGAAYTTGRIAQGWIWTENFSYLLDPAKSKVAGNILTALPPVEQKFWRYDTPTIYADSGIYAIAASGSHKEAAFLWQQWSASQEVNIAQMKALKGICTRNSLLWGSLPEQLDAQNKTNIFSTMRTAWTSGYLMGPFVPIAEEPLARDILWKHVEDAIAGSVTPENALSTAATEIDDKWKSLG